MGMGAGAGMGEDMESGGNPLDICIRVASVVDEIEEACPGCHQVTGAMCDVYISPSDRKIYLTFRCTRCARGWHRVIGTAPRNVGIVLG